MNKTISSLFAAALTLSLVACTSVPRDTTDATPPDTTPPATTAAADTTAAPPEAIVGTLPLATTQVARTKAAYDSVYAKTYADFVSDAEKFCVVPGLDQNFVPQGLARGAANGCYYVTGYDSDSKTASVIMVLDPAGQLIAEYHLYENGKVFRGHVGGIAVTEDVLYVSLSAESDGTYRIAEFALTDLAVSGSQEISIEKTVPIPVSPSWLSYADGILWVGNFYLKGSYDLGAIFNFTTTSADKKAYGGYAVAYDLTQAERKALTVEAGALYAIPDHILATPDRVQGFLYQDGVVAMSLSYGRKNNSTMLYHSLDLAKPDRTLTLDGRDYPFTVLDSRNERASVTAMPMTEGICPTADGRILILFESAANKYADSKNPTDRLWAAGWR